jgi:hypothetical protein
MNMTNEELNRRTRFFAENGLPYSDKVWRLFAESWEQGYQAHRDGRQRHNPYQPLVAFSDPPPGEGR